MGGCEDSSVETSKQKIRKTHFSEIQEIVREDMKRHRVGVKKAAERFASGFVVEDETKRERQMRTALKEVQKPSASPKVRIPELVTSAMTFLAAVDRDGNVIARDEKPENDLLEGKDFAERYSVVRAALDEGTPGYGLGEFKTEDEDEPSISMLFVAPSKHEGEVVGAMTAGIPLWRMAQRLGRQLRLERASKIERGLVLWVYIYKGDRLFHFGTPPEVDKIVPDASTRHQGLKKHEGAFTGKTSVHGRAYAYGVKPVDEIGEDVGVVVLRAEPTEEAPEDQES